MSISLFQIGVIAGIPFGIILIAWATVIFAPAGKAGQFFREHQQLTTGTATATLAILTVYAVLASNLINSAENERKRSVGAYVISEALADLQSSVQIVSFRIDFISENKSKTNQLAMIGDLAAAIKIPEALSDFTLLETQTAETLSMLSSLQSSVATLNQAISIYHSRSEGWITIMPSEPGDLRTYAKSVVEELFTVRCELSKITKQPITFSHAAEAWTFEDPKTCEDVVTANQ